MYYAMILTGLFIGIAYFANWIKLSSMISGEPSSVDKNGPARRYVSSIWREWRGYTLGDGSLNDMKGGIGSLLIAILIIIANIIWFRFSLIFLIPTIIVSLFVAQIRIGRMLHKRYFENTFPEALAVINASVSSGNSIYQALKRCGDKIDGNMGKLFRQIVSRIDLGEDPERVLNDSWEIYPYKEFYFFIMVILVSLQRGGQLRELMTRLSRIIHESKNTDKKKASMTSEARTSAKIVALIPLLFFIGMKYISPQNFDFVISDPSGRLILYYVIGSELIGISIIWLLLRKAT